MNIYYNLSSIPEFDKAVVTIGSFDGIHKGHLKLFHRIKMLAREYGGEEVVVTFHPHPRSIVFPNDKSLKLLTTLEEKLSLMEQNGIRNVIVVPFTIEFSQMSAREYLEKFILSTLRPKCLVVGYDHRFGLNRDGDFSLLQQYAAEGKFDLVKIEKEEIEEITISSTKIRKAIEQGNIGEANLFLGYHYLLTGHVIKGDSIGTSIGFPTANIKIINKDKLIPLSGIYAVKVHLDQKVFGGMLYIGSRPTLNDNSNRIEVNIFDFNENIYGDSLKIEIMDFIRNDEKYENIDQLRNQLFLDEKSARSLLEIHHFDRPKLKATIAILNYNGVEHLENYLPNVDRSSSEDCEILMIDNASTDESIDYVKEWHPEVRIIELEKNHGFAQGYNLGMADVKTPYTVLLNSDVLIKHNWLDPIIQMMDADKTIGAVQPKIKSLEEKTHFEYAGAAGGFIDSLYYPFCRGRIFDDVEEDRGQYDDTVSVSWVSGAAMVIRTELFQHLGGFDASYFAHQEEIDLCLRLQKAGYKCLAYGGSEVYHLGGGTLAYDNPNKIYLNFKNSLANLLKNAPFPKLIFLFILRLVLDGVAGIKFVFGGNLKGLTSILKAHINTYILLPNILAKRNEYNQLIRKYRIASPINAGRYTGLIIIPYYLKGKKFFSQIIQK